MDQGTGSYPCIPLAPAASADFFDFLDAAEDFFLPSLACTLRSAARSCLILASCLEPLAPVAPAFARRDC